MRTQAIIFDMDGTMIDSMPFHARSWVEFAGRHGPTIGVDELLRRTTSHTAEQLAGPHVVASVRNYHELIESNFLGNLHAKQP